MVKNIDYIKYTYLHRIAFMETVKKLVTDKDDLEVMIQRAKEHDMDKMLLYLVMDKKEASRYHREHSSHHSKNNIEKNYYDYLEMVIDWECARFTKADKPLNAYDTLYQFYPELKENIVPILIKLGINKPTDTTTPIEIFNLSVSEKMIILEIDTYLAA